ncbi:MAG: GntR family transcriptional regulator [Emergencia sp.]
MKAEIKTVTEQLYRSIREAILSQQIPSGEKLTIKKLNEEYGVSSSPIREALTRLQQDGLIEYKPNIGMSVVVPTANDIREIFELMGEFDAIALRFAMHSEHKEDFIKELEDTHNKIKECIDGGSEWNALSDAFHLVFHQYANNSRLTDAAVKVRSQFTLFSNAYEKIPENRQEIVNQHGKILEALKINDINTAETLMRAHISSSQDKAFKVLQNSN